MSSPGVSESQSRLPSPTVTLHIPVTRINCSSSGDHAAALIPLSTLPTISTCKVSQTSPRSAHGNSSQDPPRAYRSNPSIRPFKVDCSDIAPSEKHHQRPLICEVFEIDNLTPVLWQRERREDRRVNRSQRFALGIIIREPDEVYLDAI
jgi:hypothetical protein